MGENFKRHLIVVILVYRIQQYWHLCDSSYSIWPEHLDANIQ